MTLETAAWLVTVACALFSARIGPAFLRHSPRLFTVMALFACVWTLVQGFYRAHEETVLADLTSQIAAFLLVYIGGLLMAESQSAVDHVTKTVPLQSIGLILLALIILPKEFSISLPHGGTLGLTQIQSGAVAGLALNFAAVISILLGAKGISTPWQYNWLKGILIVYMLVYIEFYGYAIIFGVQRDLFAVELIGFALLKAGFTFTFACTVAYHGMTDEERTRGWLYWILHFVGMAGLFPNKPTTTK